MIFMSQIRMSRTEWLHQFGLWYQYHLSMMRSVPGVTSAQRFETASSGQPPSLAMYGFASPDVFEDPYYQEVRGMREWLPYNDTTQYKRNLFSGLDTAPDVRRHQRLLVADRSKPDSALANFTWLTTVGADFSTPVRGISVVSETEARRFEGSDVGIFVPVTGTRDSDLFPRE